MGSHSLFQGIFPTQGSNPSLLHCRQIPYHLSHQGSPYKKSLLANVGEIYCKAIRWHTKWIKKDMRAVPSCFSRV